jgi:hypothetical protein
MINLYDNDPEYNDVEETCLVTRNLHPQDPDTGSTTLSIGNLRSARTRFVRTNVLTLVVIMKCNLRIRL